MIVSKKKEGCFAIKGEMAFFISKHFHHTNQDQLLTLIPPTYQFNFQLIESLLLSLPAPRLYRILEMFV